MHCPLEKKTTNVAPSSGLIADRLCHSLLARSLQMEGRARFVTGRGQGEVHDLGADHYIHLPPGEPHSVVNEGAEDAVLLYLGVATSG